MQLEYVPLLHVQRDIYRLPRGMERFNHYIQTMVGSAEKFELPLQAMNPMGKEHVPAYLDAMLAAAADDVAAAATAAAQAHVAHLVGSYRVALILADDAQGGWTNRWLTEAAGQLSPGPNKYGWITPLCWTSDTLDLDWIRAEVLSAIYRTLYVREYGTPATLADILRQEGYAQRFGGRTPFISDAEEREYVRAVIEPLLASTEFPVQFASMYGDAPAASVGYPTLGLPERAGFDLAIRTASAEVGQLVQALER